jgi:gliding motility-associated-like protein
VKKSFIALKMKHLICLFFIVFIIIDLLAGDNPCVAPLFSTNDPSSISFDNNSATNSGIPAPPFGGYIGPDTWLSFIMPTNGFYLLLNGITMVDPAIAIYSGSCSDPKLLYNVLENNCNGDVNPFLFIDNLTPGVKYYIRVWAQNGSANGVFEIKLVETLSVIPDFLAFADATIVGECIELTQNQGDQQGCAWFQNAIDFNFPFTHEMTANFGIKDASGADGICLVYQSNGQDFCGGTGEGIGAGGMPNSAIFEFDTWSNGNLNDPSDDHCSFNVNGNMNHNNSIEGPIILGNIEDGLDHNILFEWNPAGNLFSVYFDNVLVLSGSYDIINNCFGGSNMAFWGYTSSTGGSSNSHVICPGVNNYEPSLVDYDEVDICEGESHLGYSESGFYVDFVPGPDGCQFQINTLLTVHEIPEPEFINEVVCVGEFILVADNVYTLPNTYIINTATLYGCDSIIYLELENIVTEIEIDVSSLITCKDQVVELVPTSISNFTITDINYTWSYNTNTYYQENLSVTDPGTYFLSSQVTTNGIVCMVETSVYVDIDTVSPPLQNLVDIYLDCSNISTDTLLIVDGLGDDVEPIWIYEDSIISELYQVNIIDAGTYIFIATDSINGCQTIDSLEVLISDDVPTIELSADIFNCQSQSFGLNFSTNGSIDSFVWMYENQFFSNDSLPEFSKAGSYSISIINENGCESFASVELQIDTITPSLVLENSTVPCDSFSTALSVVTDFDLQWIGPNNMSDSIPEITITEEGWYYLTVTNPDNFCENMDSSYVEFLGGSLSIDLSADVYNCQNQSFDLNFSTSGPVVTFVWMYENQFFSNDSLPEFSEAGIYSISIVNEHGCESNASLELQIDTIPPSIMLVDLTVPCDTFSTELSIMSNFDLEWEGPNNMSDSIPEITITEEGWYYLTITNPDNFCENMDSSYVEFLGSSPNISLVSDTINCYQPEVNIDLTSDQSDLSYAWSAQSEDISNNEEIDVSKEGWFYVNVSNLNGCTAIDSIFVPSNFTAPDVSISFDTIDCLKSSAHINAYISDGGMVEWTGPNMFSSNSDSLNVTEPGLYFLTVSNLESGCQTSDIAEIIDISIVPEFSIVADTLDCLTESLLLPFSISTTYNTIEWAGPNGYLSDIESPEVSQAGAYFVHLEFDGGCSLDTLLIIAEDIAQPQFLVEYDSITCNDPNVTFDFNLENAQDDFLLTSPSGSTSSLHNYSNDESGQYYLSLIGENGCQILDTFSVSEYLTEPQISIENFESITCYFPILNVTSSSPESNLTYNWTGINDFSSASPEIIIEEGGEYALVVTNQYGCTNEVDIIVNSFLVPPEIVLEGEDITCDNLEASLNYFTEDDVSQVLWLVDDSFLGLSDSILVSSQGWYSVEAINEYGCTSTDSFYVVSYSDAPYIELLTADTVVVDADNPNGQLLIDADIEVEISWFPETGLSCVHCFDPIISSTENSIYEVTVRNEYGCTATEVVHVRYEEELKVYIPNIFSPSNQDGINDFFTLYGNENIAIINSMKIYDRWGSLVGQKENFEPNNPSEGWDGVVSGQFGVSGVYTYVFLITDTEGKVTSYYGDLTLL